MHCAAQHFPLDDIAGIGRRYGDDGCISRSEAQAPTRKARPASRFRRLKALAIPTCVIDARRLAASVQEGWDSGVRSPATSPRALLGTRS